MTINGKTIMSGSSQDELTVIEVSAQSLYFSLFKRDSESIVLKDNQDISLIQFKILKTFEFSSDRKMMSVVVQSEDKRIFSFVKGADSSIE
jgi:magnesium-transporting ATPase (P-type)